MTYKCNIYPWGIYLLIDEPKRATEIADKLCEFDFCVTDVEIQTGTHSAAITILDHEAGEKMHQLYAILRTM